MDLAALRDGGAKYIYQSGPLHITPLPLHSTPRHHRDSEGGSWFYWRQLSYTLKTQLKALKAPLPGHFFSFTVFYGIRDRSWHHQQVSTNQSSISLGIPTNESGPIWLSRIHKKSKQTEQCGRLQPQGRPWFLWSGLAHSQLTGRFVWTTSIMYKYWEGGKIPRDSDFYDLSRVIKCGSTRYRI